MILTILQNAILNRNGNGGWIMKVQFLNPERQYTAYPFWFWNDALDEGEIIRQINEMNHKGIHGFVLHSRIGLPEDIAYLSDKFFYFVKIAVAEAKRLDMTVILYDEGMYPSGSANGQVVRKNPEFASKGIYSVKADDFIELKNGFQQILFKFTFNSSEKKIVQADSQEPLENVYYLVHEDSKGTIRGIHYGEDDGEENAPLSVDLLNRDAVNSFIELTHQRYYEELSDYFGSTIIGFFTDEPDILGRNAPKKMLPFNESLFELLKEGGFSLEEIALTTLESHTSLRRQKYRKIAKNLLSEHYYKPISSWCDRHGIFLTGHPENSDDIGLQEHFHIPGQDTVWRWVAPENDLNINGPHSTLAKCSSDAARHMGIGRNANEVFGCCGKAGIQWSFSPKDMKWYLNWLFIRGVNLIIPHAFFYSIKGKRRDERAPDVGMHNLWWEHYDLFTTFIKRCSYMLSSSVNQTNIAVLAESDFLPHEGIDQLYEQQIEFNYLLDDYLFNGKVKVDGCHLLIEQQSYNTLLIPKSYGQTQKVQELLQSFEEAGGKIIIFDDFFEEAILDSLKNNHVSGLKIVGQAVENIRMSTITKDQKKFYALSNEGFEVIDLELVFINPTNSFEVWDPLKGTIEAYQTKDSTSALRLKGNEFVFISETEGKGNPYFEIAEATTTIVQPYVKSSDQLVSDFGSWTIIEGMETYSGSVTYTIDFLNKDKLKQDKDYLLDLDEVREFVTLYINGEERDTLFWAPYQFVVKGDDLIDSEIQLKVTNTLANRYDGAKLDSGLLDQIHLFEI